MFNFPTKPGSELSRDQVLFSWALAECYSPRWQADSLAGLGEGLKAKIARGETRDFSEAEQREMIDAFTRRRLAYIMVFIDRTTRYKLIPVPGEKIGLIPVLPTFSHQLRPVSLNEYLDGESLESSLDDPRQHALKLKENPPKPAYVGYPIVAFSDDIQTPVLIEGYVRCITALWKQRAGETIPPMLMIYGSRD